jgi:hypothetical protein
MMDHDLGLYYLARINFTKAARAGKPEAQNMMGWYWANGLGHLPKDIVNACNWYAAAAEQGLADAMNNLGACYEYPGFMQQDIRKAITLYTSAARKGNVKARESLVRLERAVPPLDVVPPKPAKLLAQSQAQQVVQPPSQHASPQPVQQVAQQSSQQASQPARRQISQQSVNEASNIGSGLADVAVALLTIFVASKGYGYSPPPVFIPPPTINVHCASQLVGQTTVLTNCN